MASRIFSAFIGLQRSRSSIITIILWFIGTFKDSKAFLYFVYSDRTQFLALSLSLDSWSIILLGSKFNHRNEYDVQKAILLRAFSVSCQIFFIQFFLQNSHVFLSFGISSIIVARSENTICSSFSYCHALNQTVIVFDSFLRFSWSNLNTLVFPLPQSPYTPTVNGQVVPLAIPQRIFEYLSNSK